MSKNPDLPPINPYHNPDTSLVNAHTEVIHVKWERWPVGKPEPPAAGRPPNPWLQAPDDRNSLDAQ